MTAPQVFRYLLVLESGEPAEPAAFVTPRPNWGVGDVVEPDPGRQFHVVDVAMGGRLSIFGGVLTVRPATG